MKREASTLLQTEARLAFWMLLPAFAVVMAFVVFPVLWNLWLSFKPVTLSDLRGESLLAWNWGLGNFEKVLSDPEFGHSVLITLTYTVVGSRDKVERIWWKADDVLYWVSNTLSHRLSESELLAVAESMIYIPAE